MRGQGLAYLSVVLQPLGGDLGNAVLHLTLAPLVASAHGRGLPEGVEQVGVDVLLEIGRLF